MNTRQALADYEMPESGKTTREELLARIAQVKRNQPPRTEADNPDTQSPPQAPVIQPATLQDVMILGGDLGQRVDAKVHELFPNIEAIRKVNYDPNSQLVQGSNPFYNVAVNMAFKAMGHKFRTASQADLELARKKGTIDLSGTYEDSSLVWRSNANPNEYLARNIDEELKRHSISHQAGKAYVLPLYALGLEKDSNSPEKLSFKLISPKAVFESPILMSPSGRYINSANMNESRGLPNQVYETDPSSENRQLFTRNSGLSRLCLDGGLYVDSYGGNLADSDSDGRVVYVSGEASAPKNSGGKA